MYVLIPGIYHPRYLILAVFCVKYELRLKKELSIDCRNLFQIIRRVTENYTAYGIRLFFELNNPSLTVHRTSKEGGKRSTFRTCGNEDISFIMAPTYRL